MGSNLNGAAKEKKNLILGAKGFIYDGKELEFPPVSSEKYPIEISTRALREYIARGGEVLVIPAEKGGKPVVQKQDDRDTK